MSCVKRGRVTGLQMLCSGEALTLAESYGLGILAEAHWRFRENAHYHYRKWALSKGWTPCTTKDIALRYRHWRDAAGYLLRKTFPSTPGFYGLNGHCHRKTVRLTGRLWCRVASIWTYMN